SATAGGLMTLPSRIRFAPGRIAMAATFTFDRSLTGPICYFSVMKPKIVTRMSGLRRHGIRIRNYRPGAPPGALEVPADTAAVHVEPATVSLLRYAKGREVDEQSGLDVADCKPPPVDADGVTWVHLQGTPTSEQLQVLGRHFDLHPLALEDVFNHEGRAK